MADTSPEDPASARVPPLPPQRPAEPVDPPQMQDAVTSGIGQTIDAGTGRIFPCDGCGADLEFHIGAQQLVCRYCGYVREIKFDADATVQEQDFHAMLERLQAWREQAAREKPTTADEEADIPGNATRKELRCESCGGNVEFIGTLTSSRCPYCDSPMQLENAHQYDKQRIPVDGMLPFQIEREQARSNLSQWVDSRWFAPNSFRQQGVDGKFNGVYLSYFTFDSMTFTAYTGQRGEHYWVTVGSGKNRRREMRTRWYPASGRFQRFFDDVLVLANTGLSRKHMLALEPWPLAKVVPFNQQMLAGLMARTYDMELDLCFGEGRQRIDSAIQTEVRQRIGGDAQQVHSVNSRYDAVTFKHLLLPVWLLAYRHHQKTFQVFINAATGEVQGERPYSVWKILLAVITAAIAAGGIYAASQK